MPASLDYNSSPWGKPNAVFCANRCYDFLWHSRCQSHLERTQSTDWRAKGLYAALDNLKVPMVATTSPVFGSLSEGKLASLLPRTEPIHGLQLRLTVTILRAGLRDLPGDIDVRTIDHQLQVPVHTVRWPSRGVLQLESEGFEIRDRHCQAFVFFDALFQGGSGVADAHGLMIKDVSVCPIYLDIHLLLVNLSVVQLWLCRDQGCTGVFGTALDGLAYSMR